MRLVSPTGCSACDELLHRFKVAAAKYCAAVRNLSQAVGSGGNGSFSDAQAKARQRFEECQRARDSIERHHS